MKYCGKCKIIKSDEEFSKYKKSHDGLQFQCKPCQKIVRAEWYKNNTERQKELVRIWKKKNPEKEKAYCQKSYLKNIERAKRTGKKWYLNNKQKVRGYGIKKKFNLTLEEYDIIFLKQEGKCKICNSHQSELKKILAIDHDHKTGVVRGLLCESCNKGIGFLKDNIEYLSNAIQYLERFNK
jgi:hypothetical protein